MLLRPVGVALDNTGALLVVDDVGNIHLARQRRSLTEAINTDARVMSLGLRVFHSLAPNFDG